MSSDKSTHPHWKSLNDAFYDGNDSDFLEAFRASKEAMEKAGGRKSGYIPSEYVWRLLGIAEFQDVALSMVMYSYDE